MSASRFIDLVSECARTYWDYVIGSIFFVHTCWGMGIAQLHTLRTVVSDALGINVHSNVCVCKLCLWIDICPRPRVDTSRKCVSQFKLYINVAYVGNCICIPLRRQYVQMEIVFQPHTAAQVCAASIVLCLLVLLLTEIWCILLSGTRGDCCLHPQS